MVRKTTYRHKNAGKIEAIAENAVSNIVVINDATRQAYEAGKVILIDKLGAGP